MHILTDEAKIVCGHKLPRPGEAKIIATQDLVAIKKANLPKRIATERMPILVRQIPPIYMVENCPVENSQNTKKCMTLTILSGYSRLVRVQGKPICLENLRGITDGMPLAPIKVEDCGQDFVSVEL